MCQEVLYKKLSEMYKNEEAFMSCTFQTRSDPNSTALQNLKDQQFWRVYSAQFVYFALHKPANFQWKPGFVVSGLRN